MRIGVVMINIVPVTCGKMDAKHACAIIKEMTHGVMELKVLTMINTFRIMERTHLVIAIETTGNAILIFFNRIFLTDGIGSVRVD